MPYQPAVLGSARLNNFRLNYLSDALRAIRETRVLILIDDLNVTARVRRDGLTIQDEINDAPNTASFRIEGAAPTVGETVRITLNTNTPRLLFNGTLEAVDLTYEGRPNQLVWACSAQDDQARVAAMLPFVRFVGESATTAVQYLVAIFAPAFTATHVQAGLPYVSVILDGSEGFGAALAQIAKLIGGYYYWDDGDLHFFLDEWTAAPDPIDDTHPFLDEPPITVRRDKSQLRTRVYGRGHGEQLLSDVAASETILPVANAAAWFNPSGGRAITESQRFTYTGVQAGGTGTIVGPGQAPTVAPTLTPAPGSGLTTGVHQLAYTFVTASGETLPSPVAPFTAGVLAAPTAGPAVTITSNAGPPAVAVGSHQYTLGIGNGSGPSIHSAFGFISGAALGAPRKIIVEYTVTAAMVGWYVRIWRNDGAGWFLCADFTGQTAFGPFSAAQIGATYGITDSVASGSGIAGPPGTDIVNQVEVTVPLGPSGTTARKIYMTAAGGSQLKLAATIANNTTTTPVTLSLADGSLGANAPTSDTSGLVTVQGQINAGSSSIVTPGALPFLAGGGWAITGQQIIRYTGISGGTTLTGIPASGLGAIVTTIPYGTAITAAPALTGVAGLTLALQRGVPINLWVQRDDLAAQSAIAAAEGTTARPSTGVYEYLVVDERRAESSLTALCDAYLALYASPIVTVSYDTRDVKTKSGKPIVFDLASPAIDDTLTIQSVTISEIDVADGLAPRYHVAASSVKYTLEALLRSLTGLVQD